MNGVAHDGVEEVRIVGRVKWFDVTRGYGFIVPDAPPADAPGDVLLHVSVLRRFGRETAPEGARIECGAARRDRGLQAVVVHALDESTAQPLAGAALRRALAPQRGPHVLVVVKWFNRAKGYGFVNEPNGGEDVFIHIETLRRGGLPDVSPGENLLARFADGPRGRVVVDVRPRDES